MNGCLCGAPAHSGPSAKFSIQWAERVTIVMQKLFVRDASFYEKLLAIAVPVALQNLITVGVSMLDTLMLGSLGEVQLSASSLANQWFYMLTVINFGLAGGANVLVAQYWGKGEPEHIKKVLSITYKVSIVISLLFAAAALCIPEVIMSIFTPDAEVIAAGCQYLRIIGWVYPLYALGNNTIMILRAVGTVRISLLVYSISFVVNGFLNWVFIFGNLGAPRMEIQGAALATAIARVVEFLIVAAFLFRVEDKIFFRPADVLAHSPEMLRSFASSATPIIFNDMIWALGNSMITVIMGRMGKEFVAANSINSVVMQFATVAVMGLSSASAAIIGNTVGAGEYDRARERARTLVFLGAIVGAVGGLFIFTIRPFIIGFYNISDITRGYAMSFMAISSVLVFFQAQSGINMMGTLRGGGDGKFVMVSDVIFMWMICIPLGYVAGLRFGLAAPLVYMIIKCDEVLKSIIGIFRVLGGKWVRDMTRQTLS